MSNHGSRALGVLSYRQATRLASTDAGAGQRAPAIHATPKAYFALTSPEASAIADYWRDGAFVEAD